MTYLTLRRLTSLPVRNTTVGGKGHDIAGDDVIEVFTGDVTITTLDNTARSD